MSDTLIPCPECNHNNTHTQYCAMCGHCWEPQINREELREDLAAYAHKAWSGWMKYMFGKCERDGFGNLIIPFPSEERWTRQMNTPYADLPDNEKESDRKEADEMLKIMEGDQ